MRIKYFKGINLDYAYKYLSLSTPMTTGKSKKRFSKAPESARFPFHSESEQILREYKRIG